MTSLEDLIPATIDILQPLISRPKLSDKLLSKPPFRFLHDIITNLQSSNGFITGLYKEEELDAGNINDKDSKINFLNKIIKFVTVCTGENLDIKAAKVVAGLEPENTNIFLQALARCALNKSFNYKRAVETALANSNESRTSAPSSESKMNDDKDEQHKMQDEENKKRKEKEREEEENKKRKEREEEERKRQKQKQAEEERQRREKEAERQQVSVENKTGGSKDDDESGTPAIQQFQRPSTRGSRSRTQGSSAKQEEQGLDQDFDLQGKISACDGTVEKTQEMMEKIISRPQMVPKLLAKPPFRFLHDTITAIIKTTGFAIGLYSEAEMDSANVTEKAAKLLYLQKIISCVGFHLNVEVEARPAKIVAGLEAGDTNKFLQLFTVAATCGNSASAVSRALSSLESTGQAEPKEQKVPAGDTRETAHIPVDSSSKSIKPSTPDVVKPEVAQKPSHGAPVKISHDMESAKDNENDTPNSVVPPLDTSADAKDVPDIDPKRVGRPTTARKRPPKLKENVKEVSRLETKVVAPAGIMKDGDNQNSDDEEEQPQDDAKGIASSKIDAQKHGKLVRNILENQSKEEDKGDDDNEKKSEGGIRLGKRKKEKGSERRIGMNFSREEVENLRDSIQKLCQATNPLGKCLEYVHEDIEAMNRELEQWRSEYRKKCDTLEDEKKKTEEELMPLRLQLVELDEEIKEKLQKVNGIKAIIAKNEQRAQQLLRMVVSN